MPRSLTTTDRSRHSLRMPLSLPGLKRPLSRHERDEQAHLILRFSAIALVFLIVAILAIGYLREVVLRGQETVAMVGDEPISASDLLVAARPAYATLNRQAQYLRDNGFPQAAAQVRASVEALPSQVLSAEIDRRLLLREAERRQLAVTSQDVDADIRQQMEIEAMLRRSTAEPAASPSADPSPTPLPTLTEAEFQETYAAFLSEVGLSNTQYRQYVRDALRADKTQQALTAEVPTSAEQVHARHILVADQAKAEEVLQKLRDGASFEELAKTESTDAGSKEQGGDLGWFPRGIMNQPFEDAAFSAMPGGDPQIVVSPSGVHVLQVLERSADRPISAEHLDLLKAQRLQEWLDEQRSATGVKVMLSPETSAWVVNRLLGRII